MPALREAIAAAKKNGGNGGSEVGFKLVKPKLHHFQNPDAFLKALKDQAENTALIPLSNHFRDIDIDGKVGGTGWRLSKAAFGDLCHWTNTPVSFVKRLAKIDESLALDVLAAMMAACIPGGAKKELVIDTRDGRIEGIVGKETYSPIQTSDILEWALSATEDLKMSEGWLAGTTMRVTCVSDERRAEPKEGDIVKMGMSLENAVNGDCSAKVSDYAFRLKCMNGLTVRDHQHTSCIRHVGDVQFNVAHAIVAAAQRAEQLAPMMDRAAGLFLDESGIKAVRGFVAHPKNGGSPALDNKVVKIAMEEALDEGREAEEVTLWNFVNGVTASAKDAKTINRQTELEALGYRTLVRFGAVLTN